MHRMQTFALSLDKERIKSRCVFPRTFPFAGTVAAVLVIVGM